MVRDGAALLGFLAMLGGCEETKTVAYYRAHESETRETVARCVVNGNAGENCGNAKVALDQLNREAFERNRKAAAEETKSGSWKPTWNGK
nr:MULTISPECIES: EexN family lipoprotein [unclassified Novosphingobium]